MGRFALVVLVVMSFALMLLGKADTFAVRNVRAWMADALVPITDVMSRPAAFLAGAIANVRELAAIREENDRLRQENARLVRWQRTAKILETENDSLRQLLNFVPDPRATFVTARIVADTGGVFAHSVLAATGKREMVFKGHAVVSGEGLVGRVIEAGQHASRILLLTDINSRIPVIVGSTRHRAILAGDNTDEARLIFSRDQMSVMPGDKVVTSGVAGVFAPGLPVGIVTSVTENDIRVRLYYQRDRLEHVRIIDYGVSTLVDELVVPSKESITKHNRASAQARP